MSTMGLIPVPPRRNIDLEGNPQLDDPLHFPFYQGHYLFSLLFRRLKYQFVMDLHDHGCRKSPFGKTSGNIKHGNFNEVSRCTLDRGIDGHTFGKLSHRRVTACKFRQIAATVKHSAYKSNPACIFEDTFHITSHPLLPFE